jgi:hypothetical protein
MLDIEDVFQDVKSVLDAREVFVYAENLTRSLTGARTRKSASERVAGMNMSYQPFARASSPSALREVAVHPPSIYRVSKSSNGSPSTTLGFAIYMIPLETFDGKQAGEEQDSHVEQSKAKVCSLLLCIQPSANGTDQNVFWPASSSRKGYQLLLAISLDVGLVPVMAVILVFIFDRRSRHPVTFALQT